MRDGSHRDGDCNRLDRYHVISEGRHYKGHKDRRNRLDKAFFADEPSLPFLRPYQDILGEAYGHIFYKNALLDPAEIAVAFEILARPENRLLPISYYQVARTEYVFALFYTALDAHPAMMGPASASLEATDQPPLATAADHYCRAAASARQIPDWTLVAQLKHLESGACIGVDPKQFRRGFEAVRDALEAWRQLPFRDRADDDHFEYTLADTVGALGCNVGEDQAAADGLDRAGVLLQRLRKRPNANQKLLANDDIFLEWDWALLDWSKGDFKIAFTRAMKARRRGRELLRAINRARLSWLIAAIAMDFAEEGGGDGYPPRRLLSIADAEIREAYAYLREVPDDALRGQVLLAEARWLGLSSSKDGRVAKIEEAAGIAERLKDPLLLAQVDIGWGDEYRYQGKKALAREYYEKAKLEWQKADMEQWVRVIERRLARL